MAESLDDRPPLEPPIIYYDEEFHPVEKREDAAWERKLVRDEEDGELAFETLRIDMEFNE